MTTQPLPTADDLQPLAYHQAVVGYLKAHEPEVWAWASSAEAEREYVERMRTMLLKECYRLEADGHAELVAQCARVAERLGVTAPVTLYQASGDASMNASLYYAPGEAHVVFSGAVLSRLQGAELDAVLGHELAHYRLWEREQREHLVADRLLTAAANDPRAHASHMHTARRFRLYTEIYADRGALVGCGQLDAAVAALVKMATGLPQVSAAGYLRQADEIFARAERGAQQLDHPEMFIRARALRLWTQADAELEAWLSAEIEGEAALDALCLIGQQRVAQLTRRVIADVLRPAWMQSSAMLLQARSFFTDFKAGEGADEAIKDELPLRDASSRDYWCYLLLDFARADRELEELPLAHALLLSQRLELQERFEALAVKELGLNKRQLARLKKDAPELLRKAEAP